VTGTSTKPQGTERTKKVSVKETVAVDVSLQKMSELSKDKYPEKIVYLRIFMDECIYLFI
jgi:hypothetical protein